MDKQSNEWNDFLGRFQNYYCPLCKNQTLMFSDAHFGEVAGMEVAAVTCSNCAHVELFNVAEIRKIAKEIDEEYRRNGWR